MHLGKSACCQCLLSQLQCYQLQHKPGMCHVKAGLEALVYNIKQQGLLRLRLLPTNANRSHTTKQLAQHDVMWCDVVGCGVVF